MRLSHSSPVNPNTEKSVGDATFEERVKREFTAEIVDAGITPPEEIIADGQLHRFPTNGCDSDDAGWYVLYGDDLPAGAFGCWRTGVKKRWRMDSGRQLTAAEERELSQREKTIGSLEQQRRREAEEVAAKEATRVWYAAKLADDSHPYLQDKGVKSHGLRVEGDALLVPVMDGAAIISLQRVYPNRNKRFQKGGRIRGGYFTVGNLREAKTVILSEGYATAASIYESTSHPTLCAFSAGNIAAVASSIRSNHPDVQLIIAADNDEHGRGRSSAMEAAQEAGAIVVMPEDVGTDWNDVYREHGRERVRTQFEAALGRKHHTMGDEEQEPSLKLLQQQFLTAPSHGLASDLLLMELGERVIFERFSARGDGQFYVRHNEQCFYEPVFDIRARAREILETAVVCAHKAALAAGDGEPKQVYNAAGNALQKARTNDFLKSAVQLFAERVTVPDLKWNTTPRALPTLTGIIDFSTSKLEVRSAYEGEHFKDPIPVSAREIIQGGETPAFNQFLSELFPNPDTRQTALQVASMAVGSHGWKVFVVCTNESGNNGKNLFFNVLARLLPRRVGFLGGAVIQCGAEKSERRFGRAELEGLTLAVFDESSGRFDLGEIKKLTGLSPVKTERKGKDPKNLHPTWAPIALCNQLPEFSPATDHAFLSRLIVLPFNRVFYDSEVSKDRYLALGVNEHDLVSARDGELILREIATELPAVLRVLIVEYMAMHEFNNGKPYESRECMQAKEQYRSTNDRMEEFFSEYLERDPNGFVTNQRLLELWETLYGKKRQISTIALSKELVKRFKFLEKDRRAGARGIGGAREVQRREE